jgi:dethiobiotin synthetase
MALSGLFVTGTDTGVGKTTVAAWIARELSRAGVRVGALKPVATGAGRIGEAWRCEDGEALIVAIGGGVELERVVPLIYEEPLAPVVAARRRGEPLAQERVWTAVARALAWWSERAEMVIVEGVGGLLCPLAEGTTVADLAIELDYPLVIVARRGLGTLNHTLLTIEAARRRGLRIAGVVLNAAAPPLHPLAEATNAEELARRLDEVPILAELPHVADRAKLSISGNTVDWKGRAAPPRLNPRGKPVPRA